VTAKTYDLAQIIADEKAKLEPLVITAGGETFEIPWPPVLWPDEIAEMGYIAATMALLGDRYDAFCKAGGTAALLFTVIIPKATGADLPESAASTDS
jgi:hypothetical protein